MLGGAEKGSAPKRSRAWLDGYGRPLNEGEYVRLGFVAGYAVVSKCDEEEPLLCVPRLNVVISIIRSMLPGTDISPERLWRLALGWGLPFDGREVDGLSSDWVLLNCGKGDLLIESV